MSTPLLPKWKTQFCDFLEAIIIHSENNTEVREFVRPLLPSVDRNKLYNVCGKTWSEYYPDIPPGQSAEEHEKVVEKIQSENKRKWQKAMTDLGYNY